MRYQLFDEENNKYPICLVSRKILKADLAEYVVGVEKHVVAYAINVSQKAKNSELQEYLDELLPILCQLETDYIICTDGPLFKYLTKVAKPSMSGGYVHACKIPKYEHINVLYAPNPQQLFFDPSLRVKIQQMLTTLRQHSEGKYSPPGESIFEVALYPKTVKEIHDALLEIVDRDLTVDIETYDLKHYKAGIGSIALAWSKTEGMSFAVDLDPENSKDIRNMLIVFFETRARRNKTKTIYHNGSFDITVLISQLMMETIIDNEGLLHGLSTMMVGFEDTQILSYLATNSCSGNFIGLKYQAQEYAGNYMVDVTDITKVPLPDLLRYNLTDALATWFVYEKNLPKVIEDNQLEIYETLLKPCTADIIQMQLTGLPINMAQVLKGKAVMQNDCDQAIKKIEQLNVVIQFEELLAQELTKKKNLAYKKKQITVDDIRGHKDCKLNLNSPVKLQKLLYEVMGLPIISETDSGQPGTDGDTLKALIHHTDNPEYLIFLQSLVDYKAVEKILNTFVPAFESAVLAPDGHHYLFGFYNLGGTLSGRLSSNNPNMQNFPSTGSKYAYLVKEMFSAPDGWLFCGLDFNSLEDMISALTTKDPNKIRVYTDGYDGHSLRAFYYFRDLLPDIVETVESINSIQTRYKPLRQDSKAPTFALTYQGTYRTLMVNCGFSEEKAKKIETAYHEMYAVSDAWVQDKLQQASNVGYVTVAFGLRLRTPLLKQCVLGTSKTPYEAAAEGRTAGNALGQSYGLLNSRAYMAFMREVRKSPYANCIRLCAQIHDAGYLLIRNDALLVEWVNRTLVKHAQWQELPEIQHDQVKLGGQLSIFYPTWANEIQIPNNASMSEIQITSQEQYQKWKAKKQ